MINRHNSQGQNNPFPKFPFPFSFLSIIFPLTKQITHNSKRNEKRNKLTALQELVLDNRGIEVLVLRALPVPGLHEVSEFGDHLGGLLLHNLVVGVELERLESLTRRLGVGREPPSHEAEPLKTRKQKC